MLFRSFRSAGGKQIKTLIDEFEYPRLGPGMMWEAFRADVERMGGRVVLHAPVAAIEHDGGAITAVDLRQPTDAQRVEAERVHLDDAAARADPASCRPPPPDHVRAAAERLNYRDFLTVALIVDAPELFPDNWIYVHDPRVKLGRIQNFKNWSPDMVPDREHDLPRPRVLLLRGRRPLDDGRRRSVRARRARRSPPSAWSPAAKVIDGTVVRMPKAYPVYDDGYEDALDVIRDYLSGFRNLQLAGRNGMHKYNNQDHSMVTALLAAQNLLGEHHDVWAVNADDEYHEESEGSDLSSDLLTLEETQPPVPPPVNPGRA